MSSVLSWLKKKGAGFVDPNRGARITVAADAIADAISRQRDQFNLEQVVAPLDLFREDVVEATEATYKRFAERGVADGVLSEKERTTLAWIAQRLGVDDVRAKAIRQDARRSVFFKRWTEYFQYHELTASGLEQLRRLAAAFGLQPAAFGDASTAQSVLSALTNAFRRHERGFRNDSDGWRNYRAAAGLVGISEPALRTHLSAPASTVVAEAVANANADGEVSADEIAHIRFLMDSFGFSQDKRAGIESALARVNLLRDIEQGRLPSLNVQHIGLRAGEIVYANAPARYFKPRQRNGQVQYEPFDGTLLITDNRLIFAGSFSFELSHRKVQGMSMRRDGFELSCSGRGAGGYVVSDPPLTLSIFQSAVKRANQTLVSSYDPVIEGRNWYFSSPTDGAGRGERGGGVTLASVTPMLLRRLLLGITDLNLRVSHINGDPLDCRRANLRVRERAEVCWNSRKVRTRHGIPCSSRFKGVCWDRVNEKWMAQIRKDGVGRKIGRFHDEIAAAQAYDDAARELFGEHARLNFPDGVDARLEQEAREAEAREAEAGDRAPGAAIAKAA